MSPMHIKLVAYGGIALIAWWCTGKRKAPSASVELGVGTVDGVFGNDTYYSIRPGDIPEQTDSRNPAVDPVMRDLIDRSNAAIAADD